ncbi:MAG: tetratricopeptide repeat protein [Armatimonadetes bacterium]|nr:tetratricopeptide repeat protein [Armatimonadota bacterium]MDW8121198.1 tetratricopeptide repeat protein [Armatimonadota bacterium]
MKCRACQADLPDEAAFCWRCGLPVRTDQEVNPAIFDLAREYSERVSQRPQDADARYNLARALIQLKRWGPAIKELLVVRELQPDFPDALYWLAVCYWHLGQRPDSQACLRELLKIDPHNPDALKLLHRLGNGFVPSLSAGATEEREEKK